MCADTSRMTKYAGKTSIWNSRRLLRKLKSISFCPIRYMFDLDFWIIWGFPCPKWVCERGHFEGKRVGTPFPLLKCSRTLANGRLEKASAVKMHCEPFSGQNALHCNFCCFFRRRYPEPLQTIQSPQCLDPDTNFRLARQRSHCYCFTKRPQRLKTFLFSRSYQDTIVWLVCYYHHSSLLSGNLWSLQ